MREHPESGEPLVAEKYNYSITKLRTIAENWYELMCLAEDGCLARDNAINHQDWRGVIEGKVDFSRALEYTRKRNKFSIMLQTEDKLEWLKSYDYRAMVKFLNTGGDNVSYKNP